MRRLAPALGALALLIVSLGFATPAQAAGETISGTVTDSAGQPVQGLCVRGLRGGTYLRQVQTGPTGAYTIGEADGVIPGDYRLEFFRCSSDPSPTNNLLIPEWWDNKPDQASSDTFTVAEGETVTGKDAELQIGAKISGTISGPGGPMAACVSIHGPGIDAGYSTAPDGSYTFARLRDGVYKMLFEDCNGSGALGFEWYDNKPTEAQATPITLLPSEQQTINVTLEAAGAISGTVTDPAAAPLEGICVSVYDGGDQEVTTVHTDAAGQFTAAALFPASYRLLYADCDHLDNVAAEYFENATSLATADDVTVTGGGTTTADAQLARGGSISGLVRGPNQLPLPGACVVARDALGDNLAETQAGPGGTYHLGSLPTGSYLIQFSSCGAFGETAYIDEYWNNRATLAEANPVAVTSGADHPAVNATLGAADPVAPNTTIATGPANGSTLTVRDASFGLTSSIAGSGFQCRLDAGPWQPCASPRSLTGLSDGSHTFRARAISPALLLDAIPAARTFTVAAGPCEQARADLIAAEDALASAVAKVKRAKARLSKAKRSGDAAKIAKAKKKLKKAKKRRRAATQAVAVAEADVGRLCG